MVNEQKLRDLYSLYIKEEKENARLRNALRHAWHYMQSPESYSEEEKYFVFRAVETEGKSLEGL